jgi:ribosome-associated toxin RatA of RatAB toxin-antitoxin module
MLAPPVLLIGLVTLASAGPSWELIKETSGTQIYTRENPGERIKELKVVTKMDATVDELVSVYLDGQNHSKWYPACKSSKIVKKVNDSDVQVYHHIDNPWPVQDRDYVIELKVSRDPVTRETVVDYQDVKGPIPGDKDCVRMKWMRGSWRFAPGPEGKTVVTYTLDFDPGGNTPANLINMSLSHIGTTTFDAMSKYAKGRRTTAAQ